MVSRGDLSDKWHRYCSCGYCAHIHKLEPHGDGVCPRCGKTDGWDRKKPRAR